MSIRYALNPRARLVTTVFEGSPTLVEGLQHCKMLRNDPRFSPFFSEIVDLTNLVGTDLSFSSLNVLADQRLGDPFSRHARRALIAPSELGQCIAQMYRAAHARQHKILLADSHMTICTNLEEAHRHIAQNTFFSTGKVAAIIQQPSL